MRHHAATLALALGFTLLAAAPAWAQPMPDSNGYTYIGAPGQMPQTQADMEKQHAAWLARQKATAQKLWKMQNEMNQKKRLLGDMHTASSLADDGTAAAKVPPQYGATLPISASTAFTDATGNRPTLQNPVPQTQTVIYKPLKPADLLVDTTKVGKIEVHMYLHSGKPAMGPDKKPLTWTLSLLDIPIFLAKVQDLPEALLSIPQALAAPTKYGYLKVNVYDSDGKPFQPVMVRYDEVRIEGHKRPYRDEQRNLEMWLVGTLGNYDARTIAAPLMGALTYDQCLNMGNPIIQTDPEQCVLPDGTTFINVDSKITKEAAKIHDFDSCIKNPKNPIVNTFPRKCIAPGGRMYVEPPRVPTSIEKKLPDMQKKGAAQ